MSQENVETVRRSFDGWNRGDCNAWIGTPHPEVELVSSIATKLEGSETVFHGPAGLRQFWDEWHAVWNMSVEVAEIRDLGDTVLVLGRIRARGNASGAEVDSPVAYVCEFEGGLVRKVQAYLKLSEALETLGLAE